MEMQSLQLTGKSAELLAEFAEVLRFEALLKDVPEMFATKEKEVAELESAIQKAREEAIGKDSHVLYIGKTGRGIAFDVSPLSILLNGNVFSEAPIAEAMRMTPEQANKMIFGDGRKEELIAKLGIECLHVRAAMEKGLAFLRDDIAEARKEEEMVRARVAEFYAAHPTLKVGLETEMPARDKDHPTDNDGVKHPE